VPPGINEIPGGLNALPPDHPLREPPPALGTGDLRGGGGRGGRSYSVQTIPELQQPRSFLERPNNPLTQAGLALMAQPGRGANVLSDIGRAGLVGLSGIERQSRQSQLDRRPKMIDVNGKIGWQVGDKVITTAMDSPAGLRRASQEGIEARKIASREGIAERRNEALKDYYGRPRVGEEGRQTRGDAQRIQAAIKQRQADGMSYEKARRQAIIDHNETFGTNYPVPLEPAPKVKPVAPPDTRTTYEQYAPEFLGGKPAPKPGDKPAPPAETAQPAERPPAPRQAPPAGGPAPQLPPQAEAARAALKANPALRNHYLDQAQTYLSRGVPRAEVDRRLKALGIGEGIGALEGRQTM